MKILILPKYGKNGASSRYRLYNYIPYFEKEKIEYVIKPLLSDHYINDIYNKRKIIATIKQFTSVIKRFFFLFFLSKWKFDIIIVEKELFPFIPYFIEAKLLRKKVYALDYDDYVGAVYQKNKICRFLLGKKINKLVEKAVFTTVGNKWYYSEFVKGNLYYLPTVIDLNDYSISKQNKSSNTIVWIGSPSTARYLKLIETVLMKLIKEIPFTLKIIGGDIDLDKSIPVNKIAWSALSENKELASSDIGIMPLENNLWEKGKCGFKLIQYMASGLPVIGSDLPANEEIILHGETGFIAKDENDWLNYLKYLLMNKDVAIQMGKKGRKRVEENYSYQIWGDKYVSLIQDTVNK